MGLRALYKFMGYAGISKRGLKVEEMYRAVKDGAFAENLKKRIESSWGTRQASRRLARNLKKRIES